MVYRYAALRGQHMDIESSSREVFAQMKSMVRFSSFCHRGKGRTDDEDLHRLSPAQFVWSAKRSGINQVKTDLVFVPIADQSLRNILLGTISSYCPLRRTKRSTISWT
jgi:hypothetical protein